MRRTMCAITAMQNSNCFTMPPLPPTHRRTACDCFGLCYLFVSYFLCTTSSSCLVNSRYNINLYIYWRVNAYHCCLLFFFIHLHRCYGTRSCHTPPPLPPVPTTAFRYLLARIWCIYICVSWATDSSVCLYFFEKYVQIAVGWHVGSCCITVCYIVCAMFDSRLYGRPSLMLYKLSCVSSSTYLFFDYFLLDI